MCQYSPETDVTTVVALPVFVLPEKWLLGPVEFSLIVHTTVLDLVEMMESTCAHFWLPVVSLELLAGLAPLGLAAPAPPRRAA